MFYKDQSVLVHMGSSYMRECIVTGIDRSTGKIHVSDGRSYDSEGRQVNIPPGCNMHCIIDARSHWALKLLDEHKAKSLHRRASQLLEHETDLNKIKEVIKLLGGKVDDET